MIYMEVTGAALAFHHVVRSAKRKLGTRGQFVHVYSPDEYRTMRLWLADDWKSGFAVKADGDIVSVFSLAHGRLAEMLQLAVANGGAKLDCFEPLAPVYERYGFHVTGRDNWADEYAPSDWDYAANGRPGVTYLSRVVAVEVTWRDCFRAVPPGEFTQITKGKHYVDGWFQHAGLSA